MTRRPDADKNMNEAAPRTQFARLAVGGALLVVGFAMLGWTLYATLNPVAQYEVRETPATADDAREIANLGVKADALQRFEVKAEGEGRAVAEGLVARGPDGRLTPLVWRNNVTDPVFFTDTAAADIGKVLAAIREHAPQDAVVFAWWDLSRAIRLVAGRDAPLDDARATGLQIPAAWKNTSAQETARWGGGVDADMTKRFAQFVDALLMDEAKGADSLKALASGKAAIVAVHISDLWKVAAARPGAISVAYKDFPSASVNHGLIKSAQQWLKDEKIDGPFAVEPTGGATRLHYLPRKSDGAALIARLMPFSTSLPEPPTRLSLVWQHKGWWVWRLND